MADFSRISVTDGFQDPIMTANIDNIDVSINNA